MYVYCDLRFECLLIQCDDVVTHVWIVEAEWNFGDDVEGRRQILQRLEKYVLDDVVFAVFCVDHLLTPSGREEDVLQQIVCLDGILDGRMERDDKRLSEIS